MGILNFKPNFALKNYSPTFYNSIIISLTDVDLQTASSIRLELLCCILIISF